MTRNTFIFHYKCVAPATHLASLPQRMWGECLINGSQKLHKFFDFKLQNIWNKQQRSSLALNFIKSTRESLLLSTTPKTWKSNYDWLVKVKHLIDKKDEALKDTFDHLKKNP